MAYSPICTEFIIKSSVQLRNQIKAQDEWMGMTDELVH